jgi:transcriptional regulator with XRE-family HTH domain
MNTGTKISTLRESRKFSQEYLANLLNVSQVTICNWEQGSSIKHDHLKKNADIFEVPIEFLLDDKQNIKVIQKNSDTSNNNINGYDVTLKTPNYVIDKLFEKIDRLIEILENKSK